MNKTPLVSIVMASFNSEKYLAESLESIINQSYTNWELIVTDDCSEDQTVSILKKYSQQYGNISFIENSVNSGAAISRNKSLDEAKGSFIAFLDSDDLWVQTKLAEHVAFLLEHDAALSFSSYGLINELGQSMGKVVDKFNLGEITYEDLLCKKATFGCSTVLVDKTKVGDFRMPLLRTGQDYATWLMLLKITKRALHLPKVLTYYRITPGSISRNKFKKAKRQWQIYRDFEHLSLFKASFCFVQYAFRAVFRK